MSHDPLLLALIKYHPDKAPSAILNAARKQAKALTQRHEVVEKPDIELIIHEKPDFSVDFAGFPTIRARMYRPSVAPPYNMPVPRAGAREIIREVADMAGLTVEQIKGQDRHRKVVRARQYAMWRCRKELGWSLPMIGRRFQHRDHTTVLHAIRVIDDLHQAGTLQAKLDELYGGRG